MKLDIFKLLDEISNGNRAYIDSLSEDEVKAFHPYVVLMWLANPQDHINERTYFTNKFVNPYLFNTKNKKLLFKMMAITQGYGKTRYTFKKSEKKESKKQTLSVIKDYYSVNDDIAKMYLKSLSKSDILNIAVRLGTEKKAIIEIEKEWL